MKRFIVACLAAAAGPAFAFPQAGQDISDLWWNPAESGWGMNVIQQSGTSFVTLFAYGADNAPAWYFASNVAYQGYDAAGGEHVHAGTLYRATGPVFSAAFDPSQVTVREVGLLTLRAGTSASTNTVYTGRLTYTVDGVPVSKQVVRQAWRTASHAGTYYAALRETWSQCSTATHNGEYLGYGTLTVTQASADPPTLSMSFVSNDGSFAYSLSGAYYQSGRNGVLPAGTVTVSDNAGNASSGVAAGRDIASGTTGLSATFDLSTLAGYPGCRVSLRLAAAQ